MPGSNPGPQTLESDMLLTALCGLLFDYIFVPIFLNAPLTMLQSYINTFLAYLLKSPIVNHCTTFHRYPIFSTRYSVMCKVYTGYCGTSEIEHGLCACTVDNPLAKARGLSLRTGAQPMLYLPLGMLCCSDFNNNMRRRWHQNKPWFSATRLDVRDIMTSITL